MNPPQVYMCSNDSSIKCLQLPTFPTLSQPLFIFSKVFFSFTKIDAKIQNFIYRHEAIFPFLIKNNPSSLRLNLSPPKHYAPCSTNQLFRLASCISFPLHLCQNFLEASEYILIFSESISFALISSHFNSSCFLVPVMWQSVNSSPQFSMGSQSWT